MRRPYRTSAPAATLRTWARVLGGKISGKGVICPGPGHSSEDTSLSVTFSVVSPTGYSYIVHSHAGDDWRVCRDHVAALLGETAPHDWRAPIKSHRPVPSSDDRSAAAAALWKRGIDPRGTIAERYLNSRGLNLSDDMAGRAVRFLPSCSWGMGVRHPVMLTAFKSIASDDLVAVHRTALTSDGTKIERRMLGPVGAAAMKIDDDSNVEQGLVIGEGFETCLAARMLGFRPVWALGSAGAIGAFPVLAGVDCLTILAEPDQANARAIEQCGNRWSDAGREVLVVRSPVGDLNDVLKARAA